MGSLVAVPSEHAPFLGTVEKTTEPKLEKPSVFGNPAAFQFLTATKLNCAPNLVVLKGFLETKLEAKGKEVAALIQGPEWEPKNECLVNAAIMLLAKTETKVATFAVIPGGASKGAFLELLGAPIAAGWVISFNSIFYPVNF